MALFNASSSIFVLYSSILYPVFVVANILPEETHNLVWSYLNGDIHTAKKIQLQYLDVINNLFIETNPIPVKAAMNMMGMQVGGYRLPLYEMNPDNKAILEKSLKDAGLI